MERLLLRNSGHNYFNRIRVVVEGGAKRNSAEENYSQDLGEYF